MNFICEICNEEIPQQDLMHRLTHLAYHNQHRHAHTATISQQLRLINHQLDVHYRHFMDFNGTHNSTGRNVDCMITLLEYLHKKKIYQEKLNQYQQLPFKVYVVRLMVEHQQEE